MERICKAPSQPAAWFHQGTAFHSAIEAYEREYRELPPDDVTGIFEDEYDRLIAADMERQPDLSKWMTGGRVKTVDDIPRRRERGIEQVKGYLRYAANDPGRVWLTPSGTPAVEVEFSLDFDGIEVIGFVDQVWQYETGQIGPRDPKTGTKIPEWDIQLGVYRWAIHRLFGFLPSWGDFWMAKNGGPLAPVDLTVFTWDLLATWFHQLDKGIREGVFLPNPGDSCRTCGVHEFCSAVGSRSNEYPPIP